jgi:hypothetical protein
MILAAAALLLATAAQAAVTLTDIGSTAPTPGTNDIYQLGNGGGEPTGLNYYWDDGAGNPTTGYPSQTFTTLSNPQGYILTSVAIQTAGNGGGTGGPTQSQPFVLYVYELNGAGSGTGLTNATLIASFAATGQLLVEGDWMQWSGLGVPLAPGTNYGFAFGRSASAPGDWEEINAATGLPYAGGQACLIPNAGGKPKYSSSANNFDMTFDAGISLPAAPIANTPIESPSFADLALLAGTNVTLSASAGGSAPITYQWQTDGGSGGTLTNIPGATSTNLVVNTTGWLPGTYNYDFVASNSLGASTSPVVPITIVALMMADIGPAAPTPGPLDIAQLLNTDQDDDGFNYYTDDGAGHGAWAGQTFTTGTNVSGYVMNSLAWLSAGNGNSFPTIQLYDLYIYSLSANGTTASQIASYQAYGGGAQDDWFKWVGLSVALAPNTVYAYAFGRDPSSTGWEHIADQGGSPYAGGQLMTVPAPAGGTVTYGNTGTSSATFDIGLSYSLTPYAFPPTYTPNVNPVYAGTAVTLLESAVGPPPLSYQWLADNGTGTLSLVGGATSSNLVVNTTTFAPGNYEYAVIVTNAAGASTSAVTTLAVVAASAPVIVTDITPTNLNEGYVGETVTFSVTFAGTLPIGYQWLVATGSGTTAISSSSNPSAISNTLVLTNLQLANAGTYFLAASNAVGTNVSSTSTLVVYADPAAPASNTYGADILAQGPVAYWPLNDSTDNPSDGVAPAYDATGHNFDGLYGVNAQDGFNGVQGPEAPAFPGFPSNNAALLTQNGILDEYVTVPALDLDTNTVTITMWVNPSSSELTYSGLFMNRNGNDAAGFGFGGTTSNGMAELGYTWNTNSAATYNFNSGLYLLQDQWSFVALVVQTNQATIYLYYIDPNTGLPDLYSAVNPIAHGVEKFSGGTTWIGDDQGASARSFSGEIADVAVFNKALTSDQVLQEFSKAAGLSTVAASIAQQPQSLGAYAGKTVSFTASGINGTSPITYQWQFDGANLNNGGDISGATTASLTISNVAATNAGTYQLLVMNPVGTTFSSNATLLVVTPVPGSYEASVLADNPLLYWRLDETNGNPADGGVVAYDFVNGHNGVYGTGVSNGYPGYASGGILGPESPAYPGFPSNYTAMESFIGVADSYMSASVGSLAAGSLTYVMWIDPSTNVQNWAGLLMDRGGVGEGLGFGGDVSASGMADLGYTWNQNSTWSFPTYLFPPTNQWSLVAMVIEPTQGAVYLINSNGVQSAVNPIAHDSEEFGVAWHVGNDAQDGGVLTLAGGNRTFPGVISSVSVYLSALSSSQLAALYDAGSSVALDIAKGGPGEVTLTWSQGTLLQAASLAGPWTTNTATSPATIAATNSQLFFKVRLP